MKQLMTILSICLLASVASAETPGDYNGLPEGYVPAHSDPAEPNIIVQGRDLTIFENMDEFVATYPEIAANPECFDNTNVAPGDIVACEGAFNSATDNACYSPGALMDGFSLDNLAAPPDNLNVVLGIGSFGNDSVWAGPNTFLANSTIQYDPPVDTIAILFEMPMGGEAVTVEVFGAAGPLGAVDIAGGAATFLGINSTEPITNIDVYAANDGGEVYDCIWFGNGAVANENATWTSMKSIYR